MAADSLPNSDAFLEITGHRPKYSKVIVALVGEAGRSVLPRCLRHKDIVGEGVNADCGGQRRVRNGGFFQSRKASQSQCAWFQGGD